MADSYHLFVTGNISQATHDAIINGVSSVDTTGITNMYIGWDGSQAHIEVGGPDIAAGVSNLSSSLQLVAGVLVTDQANLTPTITTGRDRA